MKVVRVQHVSVNCHGRLDATRRFYSELFELPDLPRPEIPGIDGSWLGLGDVQLHLVDAAPSGHLPDPVAPHWCLWVVSWAQCRFQFSVRSSSCSNRVKRYGAVTRRRSLRHCSRRPRLIQPLRDDGLRHGVGPAMAARCHAELIVGQPGADHDGAEVTQVGSLSIVTVDPSE